MTDKNFLYEAVGHNFGEEGLGEGLDRDIEDIFEDRIGKVIIEREKDDVLGLYRVIKGDPFSYEEFDAVLVDRHYVLTHRYDEGHGILQTEVIGVNDVNKRDEAERILYCSALNFAREWVRGDDRLIEDRTDGRERLL